MELRLYQAKEVDVVLSELIHATILYEDGKGGVRNPPVQSVLIIRLWRLA